MTINDQAVERLKWCISKLKGNAQLYVLSSNTLVIRVYTQPEELTMRC